MLVVFEGTESEKTVTSLFGTKKLNSAMNPMLWIIAIAGVTCSGIMYAAAAPEWAKAVILALFCIVILAAIGIFIFFAVKRPECLRSEKYHAASDLLKFCERTQASPDNVVKAFATTANPMLEDKAQ